MEIKYWKIPPHLNLDVEVGRLNTVAESYNNLLPLEYVRNFIFNGYAPSLTFKNIEDLIELVEKNVLKRKITGVGVEVGAGPLMFSSLLAKRKGITKMYGIELSKSVIERIAPKITEGILGANSSKVIGVVGSFDAMELENENVDFVFDFMSLHHAIDLNKVFKECYRVLKPGGFVICFDKARPNVFTENDINGLLKIAYTDSDKIKIGILKERHFTREMNGEKEYREKDWRKAVNEAGFKAFDSHRIERSGSGKIVSKIIKTAISMLPFNLQIKINSKLGKPPEVSDKPEINAALFEKSSLIYTPLLNHFPRGISLMIARK